MHYTIAILEDIQGEIKVNFDKAGNAYLVGLYNTETKESTHKAFTDQHDALRIFQWFAGAICSGCYSYEERRDMLK